ncbi:hypothetical protein PSI15_11825 [Xenorhabdus sp. PR6a]|nr:hypothetical protein [Xenorhabdus sp. PR6a]
MKSKIVLSEPERITLQQLSLNHQHRDVRTRGTGLLMLGRGLKPRQIATESIICFYFTFRRTALN